MFAWRRELDPVTALLSDKSFSEVHELALDPPRFPALVDTETAHLRDLSVPDFDEERSNGGLVGLSPESTSVIHPSKEIAFPRLVGLGRGPEVRLSTESIC